MECQKCHKDVETIYGNGTYPNPSYKCGKCCDDETGKVVAGSIAVFLWGIFIILVITQL